MFRGAAAAVARTAAWCVTPDSSSTCGGVCAATRGAISSYILIYYKKFLILLQQRRTPGLFHGSARHACPHTSAGIACSARTGRHRTTSGQPLTTAVKRRAARAGKLRGPLRRDLTYC